MSQKIYVNLPVKDLNKSIAFFRALGYGFNQQFTGETFTCMTISGEIFVMLLTHEKFQSFTPKRICDATKATEVLICLSCESRDHLMQMVGKAVDAGGTTFGEPEEHGSMLHHRFQDLDGHIWELVYTETEAAQAA